MNKPILLLTLLCGFLLGVLAGPWLWPRELIQAPTTEPATPSPQAAVEPPAPPPPLPAPAVTSSEPEMQLKGVFIIGDDTRSVALIQTGAGQPQPYRLEQKLPNGYVVKTIAKTVVEVEKDGDTVSLPLVRAKTSAAESETPTEAPTAEVPTVPEPPVEPSSNPAPSPVDSKPAQQADSPGSPATSEGEAGV